jgi:hypothetical protein
VVWISVKKHGFWLMKLILIGCFCSTDFILAVNAHIQTAQQTSLFPDCICLLIWQNSFFFFFPVDLKYLNKMRDIKDTSKLIHKPSRLQQLDSALTATYIYMCEQMKCQWSCTVCQRPCPKHWDSTCWRNPESLCVPGVSSFVQMWQSWKKSAQNVNMCLCKLLELLEIQLANRL